MTPDPQRLVLALALGAASALALAEPTPGQKLDSGLGELPPYYMWTDPSGREPMRGIEPRANRVWGEKLDSGLPAMPSPGRIALAERDPRRRADAPSAPRP